MRRISLAAKAAIFICCCWGLQGCGGGQSAPGGDAAAHDHEHEHGEEGPHGGHIIELGMEDFHAELTHDDGAHLVGVYFLGADAKTAKPIAAESVTINVSLDGSPSQYSLPAKPQEGEAEGRSSYFELVDEPLEIVVSGKSEAKQSHARLNVTIDDKPYVGLIETEPHEHDHEHAH